MSFFRSLADALFDFDRPETKGELIFFKVFEAFVCLATLHLAWEWAQYIPRISDIVLPLGIAQYVDVSFLFDPVLPYVNAGLIALGVTAGFFRLWRFGYAAAFVLLHLQYAARYTLGEIPHSANMLGMTLLGVALAAAFIRVPTVRRRFTMGFTYFFVGLGYTLSACSKLVASGPQWVDGRHLWMWIGEKSVDTLSREGAAIHTVLHELLLNSYPLATLFLAGGLLAEASAWLMWWPRFRYPVVWAVIALHLGIYAIMGILFYLATIELLLLGLPWAALIDALRARNEAARPWLRPVEHLSTRFA